MCSKSSTWIIIYPSLSQPFFFQWWLTIAVQWILFNIRPRSTWLRRTTCNWNHFFLFYMQYLLALFEQTVKNLTKRFFFHSRVCECGTMRKQTYRLHCLFFSYIFYSSGRFGAKEPCVGSNQRGFFFEYMYIGDVIFSFQLNVSRFYRFQSVGVWKIWMQFCKFWKVAKHLEFSSLILFLLIICAFTDAGLCVHVVHYSAILFLPLPSSEVVSFLSSILIQKWVFLFYLVFTICSYAALPLLLRRNGTNFFGRARRHYKIISHFMAFFVLMRICETLTQHRLTMHRNDITQRWIYIQYSNTMYG